MKTYNKLIRDGIPAILTEKGISFEVVTLTKDEYLVNLNNKLQEELDEYRESGCVQELVDITEVIHAILAHHGVSLDQFESMRQQKHMNRGGFEKKLFLISAEE